MDICFFENRCSRKSPLGTSLFISIIFYFTAKRNFWKRIYRDAQQKLFHVFRFVYLSTCYWYDGLGHCMC